MDAAAPPVQQRAPLLFLTVLVIATSGLIYELVAGALASYVLGDSVTQFSTTIGVYLFAMGVGSYLSRFVVRDLAVRFVEVELALALVGGLSALALFVAFSVSQAFSVALYGSLLITGVLVGLEIPLLMRILREHIVFEELVAKVLGVDYLGSLLASLAFAFLFVPRLGLQRTSLFFGLLNALVAFGTTYWLATELTAAVRLRLRAKAVLIAGVLAVAFVFSEEITRFGEQSLYVNPIVHVKQTPYQRIVLTQGSGHAQLFLNGNLQFSSNDEYRYHEALVHPAFGAAPAHRRVLILGGGDGLALREVYRHPGVESVTLVDLDAGVTTLAQSAPPLRLLNEGSLADSRTHIVHEDAMRWLEQRPRSAKPFDLAIVDFPDPASYSTGKLYTRHFYRVLQRALSEDAALVVQSTSPLFAREAFWCVVHTLNEAGFHTAPYHATVPSFGVWGFVLAKATEFSPPETPSVEGLRFLNRSVMANMFVFPNDTNEVPTQSNRLNDQQLVRYYAAATDR